MGEKICIVRLTLLSSIVSGLVLLSGCEPKGKEKIVLHEEGANWVVTLNKVAKSNLQGGGVLVFGKLNVSSQESIAEVNLNCVMLKYGNLKSDSVYADNPASIYIRNYKAANGIVEADLYWRVRGLDVKDYEKNKIELTLAPDNGAKCVKYTKQGSENN